MDETKRSPSALLLWARNIFLFLPAIGLAWPAVPHFLDGRVWDAAIPVPNSMIAQIALPKAAYRSAAQALAGASRDDGEATILRAEAALRGGAKPGDEISRLEQGLRHQPASARGWTLLADALAETGQRKKAAAALSLALQLGPNDYWLAGMRARAATPLWDDLDADARASALAQVRLLWDEPLLHRELRPLLSTPDGVALAALAFQGRHDELRAMNRWLAMDRIRHPDPYRKNGIGP